MNRSMAGAIDGWQRLRSQLAGLLTGRNGWLLNALLALLCLLALVRLGLLLLVPAALPAVTFPFQTEGQQALAQQVLALYPGESLTPAVARQLEAAAIDAVVLGVITRGDQAWANIAVAGGPDRVYSQGDQLASGVEIERIEAGLVVVRENGELRRIPLRTLLAAGETAVARASAFPSQPSPSQPSPSQPAPSQTTAVADISTTPVITDDGVAGLRLDDLDALALASGLASGDVVLAIDGRPFSELMAEGSLPADFAAGGEHRVTVLRAGNEQQIDIDAAHVASWLNRR